MDNYAQHQAWRTDARNNIRRAAELRGTEDVEINLASAQVAALFSLGERVNELRATVEESTDLLVKESLALAGRLSAQQGGLPWWAWWRRWRARRWWKKQLAMAAERRREREQTDAGDITFAFDAAAGKITT